MPRLRLKQPGWETYTGPLHTVEFVNGVSVGDVPAVEAGQLAASMLVEDFAVPGVQFGPSVQIGAASGPRPNGADGSVPSATPSNPGAPLSVDTIAAALGFTPKALTSANIVAALGFTPQAVTAQAIQAALGFAPKDVTASTIQTALGFTPAKVVSLTQAAYDALGTKDATTLYVITE